MYEVTRLSVLANHKNHLAQRQIFPFIEVEGNDTNSNYLLLV